MGVANPALIWTRRRQPKAAKIVKIVSTCVKVWLQAQTLAVSVAITIRRPVCPAPSIAVLVLIVLVRTQFSSILLQLLMVLHALLAQAL